MSVKLSALVSMVRGMAVDRKETGSPVFWSDTEVIEGINQAKHDLFGRRPDAFSTLATVTEEPADLSSSRVSLEFTQGETTCVLQYLADSLGSENLDEGKIGLSVKSSALAGSILFFGDSDSNHIHVYLSAGKLAVDIYDASAGESATIIMDEIFSNGSWNSFTVEANGSVLTLTDGFDNEKTAPYAGDLIPASDEAYLGYSDIATVPVYFAGGMSGLYVEDNTEDVLLSIDFDAGSGYEGIDAINAYNADIHHTGEGAFWSSDDTLEMASWAELPLAYYASSVLMAQRSKDSFFRKAADQNMQKYMGLI